MAKSSTSARQPLATLLTREAFKVAVFDRDGFACVICESSAVDAHHILDRKLFVDGGFYLNNGASLCSPCHLEAEKTVISVDVIRDACGITSPVLPSGFDAGTAYDKWGNRIDTDGLRHPGPLFDDDGARKILRISGLLYSGIFQTA